MVLARSKTEVGCTHCVRNRDTVRWSSAHVVILLSRITQTLVSPQHAKALETGSRREMFKIIFAGGGLVKKCIGGSSGVGFCQSRNAELLHSGTATSPDFEARVVLSRLVTTLAVCVIFQRSL